MTLTAHLVHPHPLAPVLTTQSAARQLAVRYATYNDISRQVFAEPTSSRWSSLATWAGLLRESQIETGVYFFSTQYLTHSRARALAEASGDRETANRALDAMLQARRAEGWR